jgi:hypothetical protein
MKTTAVEVDYRYAPEQLHAMFDLARAQDVEKGGRYDTRSAAINIYTHPWNSPTMQEESTLMGSIYVFWAEENRLWRIEIEEGFSIEDDLNIAKLSYGATSDTFTSCKFTVSKPLVNQL